MRPMTKTTCFECNLPIEWDENFPRLCPACLGALRRRIRQMGRTGQAGQAAPDLATGLMLKKTPREKETEKEELS